MCFSILFSMDTLDLKLNVCDFGGAAENNKILIDDDESHWNFRNRPIKMGK